MDRSTSIMARDTQYLIGVGDRTFLIYLILPNGNTHLPAAHILQLRHLTGLLLPATKKDVVLPIIVVSIRFRCYIENTLILNRIIIKAGRGRVGSRVPATSLPYPRQVGQWPLAANAALPGLVHWHGWASTGLPAPSRDCRD